MMEIKTVEYQIRKGACVVRLDENAVRTEK